jgi:hypothetical protein
MVDTPGANSIRVLAVDTATAAKMICMSRSHFYECDKTGEIGPVPMRCGGKRLYSVAELSAWVNSGMPARSRWIEIWPAAVWRKILSGSASTGREAGRSRD